MARSVSTATKTRRATKGRVTRPQGRSPRPARVTAQDELDAAHEAIDELARARGELCSVISHDLRNALSVVLWNTQVLLRGATTDSPSRRFLDAIGRAYEEMSQLADDLSDTARLVDDRMVLSRAPAPAPALIEDAVAAHRTAAEAKRVSFDVEVDRDLPAISVDRPRVMRALSVLFAHALRVTPKGGTITVRASGYGAAARIAITDGGSGLPEDQRSYLFQLPVAPPRDGTRRPRQFSAVALFVAKGLIEAHGGSLEAEHCDGKGTTFVAVLPMGDSAG